MKPNASLAGRKAKWLTLLCAGLASSGPAIVSAGDPAPAPAAPAAEPPANWIAFGIGGVEVDGDDPAYQRRWQNNGDIWGGIESFHFEQLGDGSSFVIDGQAMVGLEDYDIDILYTKDDFGFVRAGYREFTTWYDGSGGWAGPGTAPADQWVEWFDDELELDRGEIWFEAGLRMPDVPQVTFGYQHLWREGEKDSTSWGRVGNGRGNIPSYYDIDEVTDIFRLDVEHTLGNTLLGGGLRYNRTRNEDTRVMRQGGPNAINNNDRLVEQLDVYDLDLFNAHIYSESRFGQDEQLMLTFGYAFTSLDTDINGGYRSSFDRDGDLRTSQDHSYFDMLGGAQATEHTVCANLWWNPLPNLVVVPSVRANWWDQSAWGSHIAGIRSTPDGTVEFIRDESDYDWQEFVEEIEVRYDGIDNLVLYGKAEFTQADGDWAKTAVAGPSIINWPNVPDPGGPLTETGAMVNDSEICEQQYSIGANWYPMMGLTVSAQYYYETFDQDFDPVTSGEEDAQLKGLEREVNDANLRVTWRALPNLTFVTRYDYRQITIDNQAFTNDAATAWTRQVESGDIEEHVFTESITWNATERFYLQGNFSYICSETDTGSDDRAGLNPGYVPDWQNDYWQASLSAGFALTSVSHLEASYYYYSADNYYTNSTFVAMPYGSIADEHAFSISYVHRLRDNMLWNIRYGYFKGDDDAAGGYNDYEAHVVSTGIRIGF